MAATLGIETPVPARGEPPCLAGAAAARLGALAPPDATVALEPDPGLDERDADGGLRRYVWMQDGRLMNRAMVLLGLALAADDGRTRFGLQLRAAERQARAGGAGLWSPGACRSAAPTTGQPGYA